MIDLQMVCFDLDGTLYQSGNMIADVYVNSFKLLKQKYQLDFNIPSQKDILQLIGRSGRVVFQLLIPQHLHSYYEEFTHMNTQALHKKIQDETDLLMPGTKQLLVDLKKHKIPICMASNGSLSYIKNVLSQYHLDDLFYEPIITLDHKKIKVKADILEEYMVQLGIPASNIMMIGDRLSDLEAAQAHKIFFIGLKSGIGYSLDSQEINQADILLEDVEDLHRWLQSNQYL